MVKIKLLSSIYTKWVLLVTGLIFAAVIFSGTILINQSRQVVYRNIQSSTANTAKMAAEQVRQEIGKLYTDLQLLATTQIFLNFNKEEIATTLKNQLMQNIFSSDERIAVINEKNMEIANNQLTGELIDRSDEKLFPGTLLTSQPYYSHKVKWNNRLPYWTIGTYINGWDNRGFLLADVSLRRFWAVIEPLVVGTSGHAFIVFKDGTLIAHPQRKMVVDGTNLAELVPVKMMAKRDTGTITYKNEKNEEFLCSFTSIPELGFGVVVQVPVKDFRDQIFKAVQTTSLALIVIMLIASLISLLTTRRMVKPIQHLTTQSLAIAAGDLDTPVAPVKSKDEIGTLSINFESMRANLKKYTEHLQEMVDEKVRQNQEILSNIEQGLFSINFDGTINPECSDITVKMLEIPSLVGTNLETVLRLNLEIKTNFLQWLKLVEARHMSLAWKKITRLAPVQEIVLEKELGKRKYLSLGYQKMFDIKGNLNKIMILVQDVTEQREMEKVIEEERLVHENEVNTILSIAKNPPELITNFLVETQKRIDFVKDNVMKLETQFTLERTSGKEAPVEETSELIMLMMRHLHTIKGDAGSYGFDLMSSSAHEAEQILEELCKMDNDVRKNDYVHRAIHDVNRLEERMKDSETLLKKLTSDNDIQTIKLTVNKIDRIKELSSQISDAPAVRSALVNEIMTIDYRPFTLMARKYKNLIERLNSRLGKDVLFETNPPDAEIPPNLLNVVDEALTHLIRNAMDHGLEAPQERLEMEKERAKIELKFNRKGDQVSIALKDNGRGIDTSSIVSKAVKMGVITREQVAQLSESEKIRLIFHQGLSTKEETNEISGRGVGMAAVAANLREINGQIEIRTELNVGTEFILTFRYPPVSAAG